MLRALNTLALLVVVMIAIVPVDASSQNWDQVNDDFYPILGQNVVYYSPIGQEFVPNLDQLDIIQLWLDDFRSTDADFVVNIRQGTIEGPILGSSEMITLPGGFDDVATFVFDPIQLVPHSLYVMELIQLNGSQWAVKSSGGPNSTYPLGRQILAGEPIEINDLWFREGLRAPVPVQHATWGQIKSKYE